jgi:hypothetical protein
MAKKKEAKEKKPFVPAVAPSSVSMPAGFKAKRVVTLPSMVLKAVGQAATVKILDEIRVSKVEGKPDAEGKKQKPADICTVTNVESGEQAILLVPAVVKSNLERDYPSAGYVDKVFFIRCDGKRKEGQRYNDFTIIEVEAD